MVHFGEFWKPEACGQTVLPDRSVLIGQKLVENAKIRKKSNETFWLIFKQCGTADFAHDDPLASWSTKTSCFLHVKNWVEKHICFRGHMGTENSKGFQHKIFGKALGLFLKAQIRFPIGKTGSLGHFRLQGTAISCHKYLLNCEKFDNL